MSIHQAALEGDLAEVQRFLQDGQVDVKDADGRTALHWACVHGNPGLCRLFLDRGADADAQDDGGWTPIMISIAAKHQAASEMLLAVPVNVSVVNRGGQTLLHPACIKQLLWAVDALLDSDAGRKLVRIKDRQGQLPLHRAAAVGSLAIVKRLIASGSPMSTTDAGGWTPMHHACAEGHGDVAAYLIDQGADADKLDADGKTPIQLCDDKVKTFLTQS